MVEVPRSSSVVRKRPAFAFFYWLLTLSSTGLVNEPSLKQVPLSQGKAASTLCSGHLQPRVPQALAEDAAPQDPELCHRTIQPRCHQQLAGSRAHPIGNAPKPPQKSRNDPSDLGKGIFLVAKLLDNRPWVRFAPWVVAASLFSPSVVLRGKIWVWRGFQIAFSAWYNDKGWQASFPKANFLFSRKCMIFRWLYI